MTIGVHIYNLNFHNKAFLNKFIIKKIINAEFSGRVGELLKVTELLSDLARTVLSALHF